EDEARAVLAERRRLELRPVEVLSARPATRLRVNAEPNTSLRGELVEARGPQADAGADGDAGTDIGRALRDRLQRWMKDGTRARLVAPTRGHADRLAGVLRAFGLEPAVIAHGAALEDLVEEKGAALAVMVGPLVRGFRLPVDRLALVSEEE